VDVEKPTSNNQHVPKILGPSSVSTLAYQPDGPRSFEGTSAAAPHISGLVALLLEQNPTMTPSDIRKTLYNNADMISTSRANNEGNRLATADFIPEPLQNQPEVTEPEVTEPEVTEPGTAESRNMDIPNLIREDAESWATDEATDGEFVDTIEKLFLPDVSPTLLILMGLSQTAYLGSKIAKKGSEENKPTAAAKNPDNS